MIATTIDLKINTAYRQSEALYKKDAAWQDDVDTLLDRMNDLNRIMTALHAVVLKLSFEIERDMAGFRQSKLAPATIKKIVALSTRLLNKIYKSDLYPGVKTSYHTLKTEISYLNELLLDRELRKDLEEDTDMNDIIQATLAAGRK